MIELDPRRSALVLIDLQKGIMAQPLAPRPAADTAASGMALAARFRAAGALVVPVHVGWSADQADAPRQPVDRPRVSPPGGQPADWSDFTPGLVQPGDLVILKRQWGAFHGTELDLQLRRRGIDTLVLGGIATSFGVESTARQAWELGYAVVLVEDACANPSPEAHAHSFEHIFPRIARVTRSDALTFATAA
ncbi:MAG: hydrolase [Candidatus Dactylopiibacterium sp.]|nr:hydrolase [Candidatus Dactylopiibacterium sp.]